MLTQDQLYEASRLSAKVLITYVTTYYRINGNITFPPVIKETAQNAIMIQRISNHILNFVSDNKDAKDIQELIQRLDNNLEEIREKLEGDVKLFIKRFEGSSPKEKLFLNRNAYVQKELARFIGQNVQPELLKNNKFLKNQIAGQSKKFSAVNYIVRDIMAQYKDESAGQLNEYVQENIDGLVKKTLLKWDSLEEFSSSIKF